ncbi:beta-ketoacyl-[acyl-carrier-protein] synthase family protein [Cochleicola gelatinilyticus]|uniref:Beta-ketoacyl synthase n=1 Tax=Cochleicola gelatinilyticus TaxID=1763537 RepID=A0A167JC32_9FLAO|nr:beta-ketoacyl synthase N-terminal-like domain-containing protein [Cochleicola gelatinilyticus]OAB80530.1 beta-ketoacyl synthase [Cochleicola gelatinilyticus]
MKRVFITANTIVSPLGFTSDENLQQIKNNSSAIQFYNNTEILPNGFHAAIINEEKLNQNFQKSIVASDYTKLEKMMILSLQDTMACANFEITDRTALLIATTKGNIDTLNTKSKTSAHKAYLHVLGETIQNHFQFKNEPIIVSNACVSGILAVAVAKRLIQNGVYDNAFIVAGDVVSKFTLSGFHSFQAMSDSPCKPYSKYRNGITIGEAAASVAITSGSTSQNRIEIIGDGSCNDANHISGPSRTGEGLYKSIVSSLEEANVSAENIDFISAHGTATLYNDEMEAVAFNRANLQRTPLHSLKGYYGHTLGASGLLEAIVGLHSMQNNMLYTSLGMDELGVSKPLNIIQRNEKKNIRTFLKTASGFGGCNTAVLFKK